MSRRNHGQVLIEKPLYSGHFYSEHLLLRTFFWAPSEYFGLNLPPNNGHSLIGWENIKTLACFCLTHFSTLTWSSLSSNSLQVSNPNPTPQLALCPVTSTRTWWFLNWRNLEIVEVNGSDHLNILFNELIENVEQEKLKNKKRSDIRCFFRS